MNTPHTKKVEAIEGYYEMPIKNVLHLLNLSEWTSKAMAAHLNISPSYLSYLFKKTGVVPPTRHQRPRTEKEIAATAHASQCAKAIHSESAEKVTWEGKTHTVLEWSAILGYTRDGGRYRFKHWPLWNFMNKQSPHKKGKGHGGRRV